MKAQVSAQMLVNINKLECNPIETTSFMNELFEMHRVATFFISCHNFMFCFSVLLIVINDSVLP
jgi:hypothetical protein